MDLIIHNCTQCAKEFEFPATAQQVSCPFCHITFVIAQFENVIVLKVIPLPVLPQSITTTLFSKTSPITLEDLNKQIAIVSRECQSRHQAATASLAVAFLFGCFAIASLLVARFLITLFCTMITLTLLTVAGSALRESGRSRHNLAILQHQREELWQQAQSQTPRIF
jgi:hypothetical protein